MANLFSKVFSLKDIMQNKQLKNVMPQISVGKDVGEDIFNEIFNTAKQAAQPYYKPLIVVKSGEGIRIKGETQSTANEVVDVVYNALLSKQQVISFFAKNKSLYETALKESKVNKQRYGINTKLYLRVQSFEQIRGMSEPKTVGLLKNITENILYGDDFPETQKIFKVEKDLHYKRKQEQWKNKVGDL